MNYDIKTTYLLVPLSGHCLGQGHHSGETCQYAQWTHCTTVREKKTLFFITNDTTVREKKTLFLGQMATQLGKGKHNFYDTLHYSPEKENNIFFNFVKYHKSIIRIYK